MRVNKNRDEVGRLPDVLESFGKLLLVDSNITMYL